MLLVNARSLQLECARVLHESLLVPVFTYGSETMIWKEKKRSRIRAVQIHNLRDLLGIRIIDKVPNARIKQLWVVIKGVNEKIHGGDLQLFGHVERMENDRIAKRVYVGDCAGSRSVGMPRKRWIDTMMDFKKKVWMSGKQGDWCRIGVNWGGCMGHHPRDESQILMRCHSCGLTQLYEACGWEYICDHAYNLKGIKVKIDSFLCFSFTVAHFMA